MALPVGAVQHDKVVSGLDASAIYGLGQTSKATCRNLTLLWLFPFWLGRLLLARRDSNDLLPPYAVLRQQSSPSQARSSRGRRFQPEHLVARPVPSNGVG